MAIFALLAGTMVAILLFTLRDVAIDPAHRAFLVAATVLAAGFSTWIIARS
jgi:hypothetical protein